MTDLLEAMDAAAIVLLKRASLSDTTKSAEPADPVEGEEGEASISESVKSFDSVFAYVQWREKMKGPPPDDKPKGKFAGLKEQFHGDAPVSRARKRPAAASNGHADPANHDAADD
jgi:hypothetical protein